MRRRQYIKLIGTGSIAATAGCSGTGGGDSGSNGNGDGGGATTSDGGTSGGTTSGGNGDSIAIAALEPQSGPFAPWANVHLQGLRIGIDEVNASDMLDRELEVVMTDTGADPSEASSAFQRHVELDDAVAVTGPVSSDVGIRTARTAEELQVPNLLHMAGSEDILSSDTQYVFRTGWLPSSSHARADAQYFEQNDIGYVGAIVADYAWGRSIESALERFTSDDVDLHIEVAPVGASDFTSYLRQMPDEVELMDFVGHPPGSVTAAQQLFDLEMDQPVLGVDPPQNVMISALGANVSNDVITRHLAVPGTDQFNTLGEKVSERYDQPMYAYPPIGYMNVMMLAEAIAEAGADPSGIADYIRTGSFDMLYANPLSYTEWGEFEDPILQYSELVEGAPSYYPNGEYHLEVVSESEPLPAPEPGA